jgi:cytoskeletal protein CcmA (bactofilin family)
LVQDGSNGSITESDEWFIHFIPNGGDRVRSVFSWIWKSLLILVLLSGLLLGFSFVERGRLAEMVAAYLDLPWERPASVKPAERDEDPWVHVSGVEAANGVHKPGQNVLVDVDVQGGIQASQVQVSSGARILGPIEASGTIRFDGAEVQGDLRGEQVVVQSDEFFPNVPPDGSQPIQVQGNIDARRITIGPDVIVSGNVGNERSRVELSGQVHGQVKGETVWLGESAVVEGDVQVSGRTLVMEPGAEVRGRIITPDGDFVRIVKPKEQAGKWGKHWRVQEHGEPLAASPAVYMDHGRQEHFGFGFHWIPTLMGTIALVLIAWLFRRDEVERIREQVAVSPWRSLWIGFLSAVVAVPVLFLLVISIIGIPLAILLAIVLVFAVLAGFAALSVRTGSLLGEKLGLTGQKEIKEVLLGTLVLASLLWIPLVGWLLLAAGLLCGFGAAVSLWGPRFRQAWKEWRENRKK